LAKIKEPSLLRRIAVRLVIVTVMGGIVGYGWLYRKASLTAAALREQTLVEQARNIARRLVVDAHGQVAVKLPAAVDEDYEKADSPYHYAVTDEAGNLLLTSGHIVAPIRLLHGGGQHVYNYRQGAGSALHVIGAALETTAGGRELVVQVEQIASRDRGLAAAVTDEFVTDGGWLGLPLLAILLAVSILTVRQTFSPLSRLSRLALEIEPGKSGNRLPEVGVPKEVIPLVRAVNSALDRLDKGFSQQREFTANAAHQLRTPLAVLRANIDTLPDESVAQRLQKDLDSMARIVSQLLLVARLEAAAIDVEEEVDLRAVAVEAATSLGPLAIAAGKSIAVEELARPIIARGNSWLLQNALSNLIENALAQTPRGTAVRIRISEEPAIAVADSGPGVPQEMQEKIFERFWRGDREKGGAGLGLSIVQRIMRLLGGSVSVGDAPGGGAVFTLHFPRDTQRV
jgi:signal transduction histidine kinase